MTAVPTSSPAWLKQLAARHWTVLFFILTAISSLLVSEAEMPATWLMVAPFALLMLNLAAAIATLPRFRRDLPLLVFHLALLLMVALLILARLTYMHSTVALDVGDTFNGELQDDERGPLHGEGFKALRFTNLGFIERYPENTAYLATYNRVRWQDSDGSWHTSEIDSEYPLLIDGYRIYTSSYRGYSPVFSWHSNDSESIGSVQLRPALDDQLAPANDWVLPDGTPIWTMLEPKQTSAAIPSGQINMGVQQLDHHLIVRINDQRYQLQPGQTLTLANGELTYLSLKAWLGYRIIADPAQSWLIATIAIGVLCLAWFYLRQLSGRQWDADR